MRRGAAVAAVLAFAGCAVGPRWQDDMQGALSAARQHGRDLVVFFALPGHDISERMLARLEDPTVMAALGRGGFAAVRCDGLTRKRIYTQWVGYGEGMGIAVLDGNGAVYATRPGPMDPPEFAAFLDLCAASRRELAAARAAAAVADAGPLEQYRLGLIYLELRNVKVAEPLLLDAALAGVADARHRTARLYALAGQLTTARRWLRNAPRTPAAETTRGYLLYKERRYREAAAVLEAALQHGELGADRQLALLFLGKALHEDRRDDRAVPLLESLIAEGTGSTFEAAAMHTLDHIERPGDHGH